MILHTGERGGGGHFHDSPYRGEGGGGHFHDSPYRGEGGGHCRDSPYRGEGVTAVILHTGERGGSLP